MWTPDLWMNFLRFVQGTTEWFDLEAETEGTPWHREDNVAVHTLMTLSHYFTTYAPQRTNREIMHAAMALLFHDFGKPAAHSVSPAGRNQYTGHEPLSSSLMFDFFTKYEDRWESCILMGYSTADLEKVGWLIDNHLPYAIERRSKRERLKREMLHYFGDSETFYDMLRSDCAGRISDDHPTKLQNVENWIADFKAIVIIPEEELQRIRAEKKAAWFAKQGLPPPDVTP